MRTSTKLWATALLFSFSAFSLSAKDLYVASAANGGSDSNDGLTAETPVAYLSQLNDVIAAGDVIHVNGMIMMSQDPNTKPDRTSGYIHQQAGAKGHQGFVIMGGAWQNITIIGEGLQSGFDSEHKGRLFRLNGGGNLTFKNLTFQNGRDLISDGGNGFWIGGNLVATFEDCKFMFNTVAHANPDSPTDFAGSNGRGGAIHKNEIGDVNLYNCTFTGNENREGNAINWCGGKLVAVGCSFMGNTTKINGTGGAIKFWCLVNGKPIHATIEHCLFMANSSGNGGAIAINETANRDDAGNDITIKDCSFIANSATMCGGLLINNIVNKNTSKVKVLNSTFAYNQAINDGAAINLRAMSKDSEFTMVNCTVVDNITQGNGGHGAGLLITNDTNNPKTNCTKRIYNCLFQGNYAVDPGAGTPKMTTSDLTLRDPMVEGEFEAYNTYFGRLTNNPILDGAAINCTVNYMPGSTKDMDWDIHNASGLSDDIAVYATKKYVAPFMDENAPGLSYGNAEYLTQFGIDKDQMGNPRKIIGNTCAVGSLEMTEAEMDADSKPWNPTLTSIANTTEDKDQIEIYVRNGEIVVGTGNNDANIQLYNMNGSILKATTGSMEITGINSGFYIVKAVLNNQISVKKIWIK